MGARLNRNGLVLWAGPSRIDGAPIVCIATGLGSGSGNAKTGAMVQTWILRADVGPIDALRTGADVSICGACVHRPRRFNGKKYFSRSCYVNVAQAPNGIWKAYKRGRYPVANGPEDIRAAMAGRRVRLGSYGDPAAVPLDIWAACVAESAGHTGYTHQMRAPRLRDVLSLCQVSADSLADAQAAHAAGLGSFRVLADGESPAPFEMVCPASAERGHAVTCSDCMACSGADGANVAIAAHGIGARSYAGAPAQRRPLSLPVLNPARVASRG